MIRPIEESKPQVILNVTDLFLTRAGKVAIYAWGRVLRHGESEQGEAGREHALQSSRQGRHAYWSSGSNEAVGRVSIVIGDLSMKYERDDAVQLLSSTPRMLDAWLRHLPDAWLRANRGEGTWSAFDVVGHLVWGEIDDWIPRMQHVLTAGEQPPFKPFDRFAMRGRDVGKSMAALLDEFRQLRSTNLSALAEAGLTDRELGLKGTHPELGVVTVRELLSTWVAHDQSHIAQIARTIAWQYRDEVGPWRDYMGVLRD